MLECGLWLHEVLRMQCSGGMDDVPGSELLRGVLGILKTCWQLGVAFQAETSLIMHVHIAATDGCAVSVS